MRRLAVAFALAGFAACSNPPFALRFRLTDGDAQQCVGDGGTVTTSCQDVTMLCDAYLSVRIVSPNDPEAPYISVCKPLTGAQHKLCAIAGIDLPQPVVAVPEQTLEVQMAIFPKSAIHPDPVTGEPVCPRVQFASNGLPMPVLPICDDPDPFACTSVPAVGGRTYYHPGDAETVVDLGCTNLDELTDPEVCTGMRSTTVTASVNDFDDPVSSVDKTVADRLNVSVGEPTPLADTYVLTPADSTELARSTSSSPTWSGELSTDLLSYACLEVLEDGAQTTTALTCAKRGTESKIDLAGFYLKKTTLAQILTAVGMTQFPSDGGLVVGMVVDESSNPLAGQPVFCEGCTIQYLNVTRTGVVPGMTSASGVFVSTDAPFGTTFTLPQSPGQPAVGHEKIGGIVEGKVTIVVLQYKDTVIGGGP